MKLVANGANGTFFREILPVLSDSVQIDFVEAAIAYGSVFPGNDQGLVNHCLANNIRLDLWMRYDHTVPVSLPLLEKLLKSQNRNIFTNFVPDCFHSKVIWWKGYGAYIGSANLTDGAWNSNIEAGTFFTDDDLVSSGMDSQLESFFDFLRALDKVIPLTEDYIAEMELLSEKNKAAYDDAKALRSYDEWSGPLFIDKIKAKEKKKEVFRLEWQEAVKYLKGIESKILKHRPIWVDESVPAAWQVDQFLHAYYYKVVRQGVKQPYEDFFIENRHDPGNAVERQLVDWQASKSAPLNEDRTLYEYAPRLKHLLSRGNILDLDVKGLEEVLTCTHASEDHIIKIPTIELGGDPSVPMGRVERTARFAPLLFNQVNGKGWNVVDLLNYVLWEGDDTDLWERIYNAGRLEEFKIKRYGLNSIAEVAGWVRHDVCPPRNGRTSKALKALGFSVKVY